MASSASSWGFIPDDDKDIYVCLFISRNKDNKDVPNFVERRKSFITTRSYNDPSLLNEFQYFVNNGVPNEMCRMYYSLNARDKETVRKKLMHFLIDEPNFNLCALPSKLASIAANKECAKAKHWFFDFDINDKNKVTEFINDINNIDNDVGITYHETLNGYAIIVSRGFDTRELLNKWSENVTLKKDDLVYRQCGQTIKSYELNNEVEE